MSEYLSEHQSVNWMQNRKIIHLLQTCSPEELEEMGKFLNSPFYNQDPVVVSLFDKLCKFHPDFSEPKLTKQYLFKSVFPHDEYDDKSLRYLLSNLTKLLEQFLAVQKIREHPSLLQLALLEVQSERGLQKGYRRTSQHLKQSISGKSSSDSFFTRMQWSEIREKHFQKQRVRKFDPSLQHFANNLDQYYFLNRLKIVCAMLDRQTILQAEYKLNISEAWIQHLKANAFFGEPLIQIYYSIFQALQHETDESHFVDLIAFLREFSSAIAETDLKDIYLFAINYCARKIRQGKEKYVGEALQLYRDGIEKSLLLDEQGLSPWAFTNVVKLALRQQQYDWIEGFINQYAPILPEQFRENALHYNLAELYYYTNRFNLAQQHLIQVQFSDLNYYLGARVLLAKIFYESGEEEALLSLISSFTIFLKRNKALSGNLKRTYLNFCQILFQIVRRSPTRMKKLGDTINNSELLTDRTWLEKVYKKAMRM